jgi:hypothetical protein
MMLGSEHSSSNLWTRSDATFSNLSRRAWLKIHHFLCFVLKKKWICPCTSALSIALVWKRTDRVSILLRLLTGPFLPFSSLTPLICPVSRVTSPIFEVHSTAVQDVAGMAKIKDTCCCYWDSSKQ